ncbi:MAG: UDP-3-O-acyl-N-acetylglucosamine deacetylase [Alphaproteobacteria bacterium]
MATSSLSRGRSHNAAEADAVIRQRTLRSPIRCSGTALHSGSKVSMILHPAEPDTGIIFKRVDIAGGGAEIPADWRHVTESRLCTAIGNGDGVSVATVEHLMAALAGCEIDNALIEMNGGEIPVMDGSAEPFVFLIECAGVIEQDAVRRGIRVLKPISVREESRSVSLSPGEGFSISFQIEYDSPAVARQECFFRLVNGVFKSEICRARTFGFLDEVDDLRAAGLVQGGSLDNAVVVSGDEILNQDGLRYHDEFVRHKVLDAIGDLYLAGAPLVGHFHGVQAGHTLTCRLLEALFADDEAWCFTELDPAEFSAARGDWGPGVLSASA